MEPIKRDGTIREQIQLEDKIRRNFPKKWGLLTQAPVNEFYNPNYLSQELRKKIDNYESGPASYVYDDRGTGESRFVSKDMYSELLAKCRCGRPRTDAHLIKCLQKVKPDYGQHFHIGGDELDADANKESMFGTVPVTSSGFIGWPKLTYQTLERSTHYKSPKNSIPGGRIDDKPYSNIFIG